jgi:D-glycerate 3-kinase
VNPVAARLLPWCLERLAAPRRAPWILGLQGPQGCGKSTATAALVEALREAGHRAATVSIDDFYLTYAEQQALAARHPGHPFLLYRGYPGTHDVALGASAIDALSACGEGHTVRVPAYDKSAMAGRGDRAPESRWPAVEGPLDVILLEGWMLGFAPVDEGPLEPDLVAPNRYLAAYRAWNERLDALAHLTVASLDTVVDWRVGSERARRARGEATLSDDEARDYIERFLPAYRVYVPALEAHPPCDDFRTLRLGPDREILG